MRDDFPFCFESKSIRDKDWFVPLGYKTSRSPAAGNDNDFATVVGLVDVVSRFQSAQNYGDVALLGILLRDVIASE